MYQKVSPQSSVMLTKTQSVLVSRGGLQHGARVKYPSPIYFLQNCPLILSSADSIHLKKIMRYNEDDVRATLLIKEWLEKHGPGKVKESLDE